MVYRVDSRGVQTKVEVKWSADGKSVQGRMTLGANVLRVDGRLRSGLVRDTQNRILYAVFFTRNVAYDAQSGGRSVDLLVCKF